MANEADDASIQQQNLIDAAIKKTTAMPLDTTNRTGCCWDCGKPTGHLKRWCDAQCRDSWEQG